MLFIDSKIRQLKCNFSILYLIKIRKIPIIFTRGINAKEGDNMITKVVGVQSILSNKNDHRQSKDGLKKKVPPSTFKNILDSAMKPKTV